MKNKLIFKVTTSVLALLYLGGAMHYFVNFQEVSDAFANYQFPLWMHPFVGVTKFLAAISLFTIAFNISANPRWLKEWTYASIFWNSIFAVIAHQFAVEPFALSIPSIVTIILVLVSRLTWKNN
jgi:hypothetical protein